MATNNSCNTYIVPTTANEVTMPSQPAYSAYLPTDDDNQTGDGAVYTLGTVTALTEIYDQNSDFNVNGTLTAPVTGKYYLTVMVSFLQAGTGTTAQLNIVTSNRTYTYEDGCDTNASNNGSVELGTLADMDAADTHTVTCLVDGIGADTADVNGAGATTFRTFMAGNLAV